MRWITVFLNSSIGKKIIVSFTGIFLCSFLVVHLSGNFLLFRNDAGEAFEVYSHFMSTNGIIRFLEIGLALGFILHIFNTLRLTLENKKARPVPYAVYKPSENSTLTSRSMFYSGLLVLAFLIIHLNTFFVTHRVIGTDVTMYESVVESFKSPVYSWFYIFAMLLLGLHLNHGFQSAFQTLGMNHKKYTPLIKFLGLLFSIVVPAGFATFPVYFLFFHQ
ncbi:MAG: succinate dehydrogenase cytochrome b subunit [Ignavibacteriaceae bacterium]|nr:succinate dehydrogenase cytochrome b subunit [Ignavibacteriaceae bacterium]